MPNPAYVKTDPEIWARTGVRAAGSEDISFPDLETQDKFQTILDVMGWAQVLVFHYGNSDRVVAPFVVGVSSEGNPLMRGYQIEGESRSGKGEGWRVFQIRKMSNLENFWDFINPAQFGFNPTYPWIYKVFAMLEGG